MKQLSLVNNYLALILAYTALNLPFAVWMLHAAFRQIPKELDEAAVMDGFSPSAILYRIILPLSRPSLAVTAVFVFIFCWNEFVLALSLMPSQSKYTVPVGIALLSGASGYEIPWGEINSVIVGQTEWRMLFARRPIEGETLRFSFSSSNALFFDANFWPTFGTIPINKIGLRIQSQGTF